MPSPYSELCSVFFTELNDYFVNYFQLAPTYRYEGIAEGDRFGVITFRSLAENRDRASGRAVRGGFQFLELQMEILMTLGASNRITSEALSLSAALDLHHGIPALKQFFDSRLIYDLMTTSDITCVKRQALKPPNNWIVDITCEATANMSIFVDINGQHLIK
ncbi:hypothetical protein VF04_03840 [Nostoc linckia z7]|uniref:Uncharacterized protein n=2 Tax=Nostoc linckia TaxID=92942 RepID=A0A9Q5ZFZ1_NOSLI|nr:hypothetical protein [Nostoc linckia]PHK42989.1 hypothetical protein VF12_01305 [Nostoc linckia z15]PHK48146.1 hypothetical protein VF13_02280 [Nostoc linckia z16]PHJ64930.1 hypothetical protein VF02_11330 [Nostoc linckia z1]PHJ70107.1 hypothetical protein VF05_11485 [Nostoc linckia z3]PHJ75008.1 hypothetical protein VF03_11645 [Nostoc linckia z2]